MENKKREEAIQSEIGKSAHNHLGSIKFKNQQFMSSMVDEMIGMEDSVIAKSFLGNDSIAARNIGSVSSRNSRKYSNLR